MCFFLFYDVVMYIIFMYSLLVLFEIILSQTVNSVMCALLILFVKFEFRFYLSYLYKFINYFCVPR
jgi:hypothetical protein